MSLNRKKINNLIILFCLIFISIVMLLEKYKNNIPQSTQALFNQEFELIQLEFNSVWMKRINEKWQCSPSVLNCQTWVNAWKNLQVSFVDFSPKIKNAPIKLTFQTSNITSEQYWQYFEQEGLLKSTNNHWYQIPPSLKKDLLPKE